MSTEQGSIVLLEVGSLATERSAKYSAADARTELHRLASNNKSPGLAGAYAKPRDS